MGFRDDLLRVAQAALKVGAARAQSAANVAADWMDQQASGARVSELDTRLEKAANAAARAGNDGSHDFDEAKAIRFDPFDLVAIMGYRERPTPLSYAVLEAIGSTVPPVADIVKTRINQCVMFMQPPENRHATGFEVRLRDRGAKVSRKSEKRAIELSKIILNCGLPEPDRTEHENVPLVDFGRMAIRDTLIFDQWAFEVVPDRGGRPAYIAMVDPTTVRLVDRALRQPGDPYAVQVINGAIVTDFTQEELAFCIRNPRSGIRAYGYGQSEVETLVREITGFLWAGEYNRRFFTQGSATKGILNFRGVVPDKHLQAFRRQWYAMVAGVGNAWRTPITNAEEIQWINMQMSNRDMEYSAWMDFLIKVCCARFQIAPEEINFQYGNAGQAGAMGQAPVEEKIKASKDNGLRPLVRFFWDQMNRHFLWRLDPDFEAVPVGLDDKGEELEATLLQQYSRFALTVDEVREELGREPLPDKKGEIVLDPTWFQNASQIDAQNNPQSGGGGMPGMGPMGLGGMPPGGPGGPQGMPGPQGPDAGPFSVDEAPGAPENTAEGPPQGPEAQSAAPETLKSRTAASKRVTRYEINLE